MNGLAEVLERFNRKERNLLVRHVLGHGESPLRLSAEFRRKVGKALELEGEIPKQAWWATDYHFDCLAGALALYVKGDRALHEIWPNPLKEGRRLVEGNQEDIDLIIATESDVILIEAKGFEAYSNSQMASKIARLNLLHTYWDELSGSAPHLIRISFLLISPRPPQKLTTEWPSWVLRDGRVPWIQLELDFVNSVLQVTQCRSDHESTAKENWRITEHLLSGAVLTRNGSP